MLRIRRKSGELINVTDGRFVEICDGNGNLFAALYIAEDGELVTINPNTPEGVKYCNLFNCKFNKTITTLKPKL